MSNARLLNFFTNKNLFLFVFIYVDDDVINKLSSKCRHYIIIMSIFNIIKFWINIYKFSVH